jgi:putative membrane protein
MTCSRQISFSQHALVMDAVPLVCALREKFDAHRRIARWMLPIWFYVSVTGVVVYMMLYGIKKVSWPAEVRERLASPVKL